ncbi:hypothetical protein Acr_28g0014560 [Actinidia rufa]|uniref:C2H2-type domain-containing protein n=1 Tax=Actinidia rufa TaxID=165716 RepID=A0A7J0HCQ0_9ERIC|nr:hypothetical protein Acr_28g0014560 [Actinidia rufa]
MAMQRLLFSDDDLSDADIKRLLKEEPAFGAKNVREGLKSNQVNYQNGYIPLYNCPRPIFGQLSLSQKMMEYQKNVTEYQKIVCSSANKVNNRRATSDVQVTEVVRDHVITISTRERVSVPNHHVVSPNQSILENINPTLINRVPKSELLNPSHQTPTQGPRPSNLFNYNDFRSTNNGGHVSSSLLHVPYPERKDQMVLPNEQQNPNSRGLNEAVPYHHRKMNGGPHTCAKCGEAFITIQCYVTHVMSHEQSEKIDKLLKKHQKKLDKLAQSWYGAPFEGHKSKKQKIVVEIEAGVKKEQTNVQMVAKQKLPRGCVVIKEKSN